VYFLKGYKKRVFIGWTLLIQVHESGCLQQLPPRLHGCWIRTAAERGQQLMALPMMPGVRGHALGIAGCSASFETDVSI
jgi:hypothetical protein